MAIAIGIKPSVITPKSPKAEPKAEKPKAEEPKVEKPKSKKEK